MTALIPPEALDAHTAILGKTGSGKSNTAKVIVERSLRAGERVVVLDPTGTWFGLRLTPERKPSGLNVLIFGGHHADVQITAAHGGPIAEIVGTTATPAIIDTRLMTVADRTRFFTAFAETLLRKNSGQLRVVVDEAHLFMPQGKVNDPQSGQMLHAANNLVSLGRGIGLRIVMVSQRPAKLHKDSLTQIETLIAMRLIAPQDRAAIADWIKESAEPEQGRDILASLPSLPTGDAWVWSPQIDVLERVRFPLASTLDTGRPTEDEVVLEPVDLETVTGQLAAIAAEAKANDPKALKAEITTLKHDLARATDIRRNFAEPDAGALSAAEQAGYQRGYDSGLAEGRRAGDVVGQAAMLSRVQQAMAAIRVIEDEPRASGKPQETPRPRPATPQRPTPPPALAPQPAQRVGANGADAPSEVPPGGARALAALAGVYPAGMTEAQWATSAGYKRTGGTWGTYKSRLRGAGLIEHREGRWFATDAGAAAAGDVEIPPAPGQDLVRWWAARLPGTRKIAEALIEAWPRDMDRDELAQAVDMTASGGTFGTYLSRLASPGLIERDGGVIRLSDEAMGPRP